jgi:hypothetical protein
VPITDKHINIKYLSDWHVACLWNKQERVVAHKAPDQKTANNGGKDHEEGKSEYRLKTTQKRRDLPWASLESGEIL